MAPLGEAVRPPYRPEPGRGRGRPPILPVEDDVAGPPLPLPPLAPIERRSFDYSDLEHCMAQMDQAIRQTRQTLQSLAGPMLEPTPRERQCGLGMSAADVPDPGHEHDQLEHHV